MAKMSIEEAMKIADVFEHDDVIGMAGMVCRVLAAEVRNLQDKVDLLERGEYSTVKKE